MNSVVYIVLAGYCCFSLLNVGTMNQISHFFAWDKSFLILGLSLQIFSCFMPFMSFLSLTNERLMSYRTRNRNFSFMINEVIVRRVLLFLGVFLVSLVVLFESDYTLFIAQCLLFPFLYPKSE